MEKDSKTTVAVERTTFTKLDRLAKANNVSKMEFLTHVPEETGNGSCASGL